MSAYPIVERPALPEARPWRLAVLWLSVLTPFFFLSYGVANLATSLRHDVPSLVFGWEHRVPFLAWTIVPYWSLDLFYAASLFVCRTPTELNTHVKRLIAAQVISVAAFLLFPLRFTFEQLHPAGVLGWMFDALASFDQPFNQAPSLHLSLATILWARYSVHPRGRALWAVRLCLILAGVSTLTTYQHHFIDVATGLWVGLFCIALFPDDFPRARHERRRDPSRFRFGTLYLAGSAALIAMAVSIGGTAWWLLWPAGALLIVAGIYFTGQPQLFRKQNGAIAPEMACLLAPYLAVAWLNSRLWTWSRRAADEITGGVWLGPVPGKMERDMQSVASMVDLAAELPVDTAGVSYRAVPMLDLAVPTIEQLDAAVKAIDDLASERPTLVCCALGYSRGAAVLAAWLTAGGRSESLNHSIALIQSRRPRIVLSRAQRERLEEWCHARIPSSQ